MKAGEVVSKGALWIASASLAVTSWLLRDLITEIRSAVGVLQLNDAVKEQRLTTMEDEVKTTSQRLRIVEEAQLRMGIKPGR